MWNWCNFSLSFYLSHLERMKNTVAHCKITSSPPLLIFVSLLLSPPSPHKPHSFVCIFLSLSAFTVGCCILFLSSTATSIQELLLFFWPVSSLYSGWLLHVFCRFPSRIPPPTSRLIVVCLVRSLGASLGPIVASAGDNTLPRPRPIVRWLVGSLSGDCAWRREELRPWMPVLRRRRTGPARVRSPHRRHPSLLRGRQSQYWHCHRRLYAKEEASQPAVRCKRLEASCCDGSTIDVFDVVLMAWSVLGSELAELAGHTHTAYNTSAYYFWLLAILKIRMLDKRQPKRKGSFAKQTHSTMEPITNRQISLRALVWCPQSNFDHTFTSRHFWLPLGYI